MDRTNGTSAPTSKVNRLQATESDNELLELKVNVPDEDKVTLN